MKRSHVLLALLGLVAACGPEPIQPLPPKPPVAVVDAGAAPPPPPPDPLGSRPDLGDPAPFVPPVAVEYKRPNGLKVWLLERHDLPIVSIELVVPAGAAHDPDGRGGLAVATANMLDEGAGKRGALEVARDLDRLGATLSTGAYADYGFVQLTVLKKNLPDAAAIFGDVVARPQMSAVEWKRVHDLWTNSLKARQSDPDAVAGVVVARKAYPAGHPYAHPSEGVVASAAKVTLDDVKRFYAARWRPDRATCVVVGDVARADVDALLDKALGGWTSKGAPPPDAPESAALTGKSEPQRTTRRIVVVDRPDAPQSVIAVARPGVSAFDEDGAGLVRVDSALGGSFTSRLNQDLREDHGWTYGAHTRFSFNRARGLFVAQAAVQTEHTGDALKNMIADIDGMAKDGLTDEEVERSKKLVRASVVEAFETVQAASSRLGRNAGVGQSVDHEAVKSRLVARVDKARLKKLSADYLDLAGATIVIVGPRAKIEPQLAVIGMKTLETSGPEGD